MEFALRAAVGSGMRRGEIVGLDVRDIDFEAGEIHVVHGTDSPVSYTHLTLPTILRV